MISVIISSWSQGSNSYLKVIFLILGLVLTLASCQREELYNKDSAQAFEAIDNQDYGQAIRIWEALIAKQNMRNEDLAQSYFHLGKAYQLEGKPDLAIPALEKVLAYNSILERIRRRFSISYITSYQSEAATDLAAIYLQKQDYQSSLAYLKKASIDYSNPACGSLLLDQWSVWDSLYLENYGQLEDWKGMISTLGAHVFTIEEASKHFQPFCKALENQFSRSQIRQEIEAAVANLVKTDGYENMYYTFETSFFGFPLSLEEYHLAAWPEEWTEGEEGMLDFSRAQVETLLLESALAKRFR